MSARLCRCRNFVGAAILACAVLMILPGCDTAADPPAPDALLQALAEATQQGKPQAVWQALPPRYRSGVEELRQTVAGRLDPQLWAQGIGVARKAARVLREREADLLQSALVAGNPALRDSVSDGQLASLIELLAAELETLEGFRSVDLDRLLATVGAPLMRQAMASAHILAPESAERFEAFGQVETTVLHQDAGRALVRVSYPDAAPEELVFINVDGTWTMKELDDQWEHVMTNARGAIDALDLTPEGRARAAESLTRIAQRLDRLLQAAKGDAFDSALLELITK